MTDELQTPAEHDGCPEVQTAQTMDEMLAKVDACIQYYQTLRIGRLRKRLFELYSMRDALTEGAITVSSADASLRELVCGIRQDVRSLTSENQLAVQRFHADDEVMLIESDGVERFATVQGTQRGEKGVRVVALTKISIFLLDGTRKMVFPSQLRSRTDNDVMTPEDRRAMAVRAYCDGISKHWHEHVQRWAGSDDCRQCAHALAVGLDRDFEGIDIDQTIAALTKAAAGAFERLGRKHLKTVLDGYAFNLRGKLAHSDVEFTSSWADTMLDPILAAFAHQYLEDVKADLWRELKQAGKFRHVT